MRAAITSLAREVNAVLSTANVEVLEPALVANPNFPSQATIDWGNPTVVGTARGSVQPAGSEVVEAAGVDSKRDWQQLYSESVALTPAQRVRVDGITYRVERVRQYPSHTSALLERVADAPSVGSGS